MIAALSFLLDYEKIQDDDDSDASSSEDDDLTQQPQVVLSREEVYKVCPAFLFDNELLVGLPVKFKMFQRKPVELLVKIELV